MKKNNLLILFLSFLFIGLTGCEDNATPTTEYTVTFDAGTGGTLTSAATVKVKSGEKVAEPTDPTREGFTFVEWRKTGTTTAFPFDTETITADITLTAQWEEVVLYTVTFDANQGMLADGSASSAVQVAAGETIAKPADPTRDGFTFVDWYKDTTFNELYDFSTAVTVDITVYARWLSNTKYTVTFDPDQGVLAGGNDNNTVQISEGEKLPKPTDPTRPDHTFVEWQKEDDTAFDFDTETITAPITLTATWARDSRMLTEIDTPSSLLRQWMQRATTQAHISNAYNVFTGGVGAAGGPADRINLYIDEMPTFEVRIRPASPNLSLRAGIPSTSDDDVRRSIGYTNLFGTDKTADGYAVSEDTLFITQNQTTLAIMVINSTEKAIFVKAGDAPGLLLYSDNDDNINIEDWVTRADLAAGAYTGASSTVLNGSGEPVPSTLGVGSTLKFFGNSVDSVQFTQSNTSADSISWIISGTIAISEYLSDTGTATKWPRKGNNAKVYIHRSLLNRVPYNSLVFAHLIGVTPAPDLVYIEVLSRGGDLKVIFRSARNATTPATEVTVTYRRPSSN